MKTKYEVVGCKDLYKRSLKHKTELQDLECRHFGGTLWRPHDASPPYYQGSLMRMALFCIVKS